MHLKQLLLLFILLAINISSSIAQSESDEIDDLYNSDEVTRFTDGRLDISEYEDFYDIEEADPNTSGERNDAGTGLLDEKRRWPKVDNLVQVPYTIDANSYSNNQRQNIKAAMREIESKTCIKFLKKTNQRNFITFISRDDKGCSSMLGMQGNQQYINLNRNKKCAKKRGIIMHEITHALGFHHMHTHADRDTYIKIYWNNINEDANKNFEKTDPALVSSFNTKYDFFSIMHYPPTGAKAKKLIRARSKYKFYEKYMGQRKELSLGDVERINKMYNCDKSRINANSNRIGSASAESSEEITTPAVPRIRIQNAPSPATYAPATYAPATYAPATYAPSFYTPPPFYERYTTPRSIFNHIPTHSPFHNFRCFDSDCSDSHNHQIIGQGENDRFFQSAFNGQGVTIERNTLPSIGGRSGIHTIIKTPNGHGEIIEQSYSSHPNHQGSVSRGSFTSGSGSSSFHQSGSSSFQSFPLNGNVPFGMNNMMQSFDSNSGPAFNSISPLGSNSFDNSPSFGQFYSNGGSFGSRSSSFGSSSFGSNGPSFSSSSFDFS